MNEFAMCEYPPCDCEIEPAGAVTQGDERFCSQRCADGRGCDHHGCNCGDFPAEEPDV